MSWLIVSTEQQFEVIEKDHLAVGQTMVAEFDTEAAALRNIQAAQELEKTLRPFLLEAELYARRVRNDVLGRVYAEARKGGTIRPN